MAEYLVKRTKQDGSIELSLSSETFHRLGEDVEMIIYGLEEIGIARRDADLITALGSNISG